MHILSRISFAWIGVALLLPAMSCDARAQTAVCLYESKSYSEGAYLCVRKGLMLGCSVGSGKASWTVVAERTLSDLCVADYRSHLTQRKYRSHRRHAIASAAVQAGSVPSPASAKCFSFNGKRYCE